MFDLIIRGALVVDPLNKINAIKDVAVAEGKITAIEDEISLPAKKLIEASGKVLIPGIIDMHTHMRTVLGHKHAQRMIALHYSGYGRTFRRHSDIHSRKRRRCQHCNP